MGFKIILFVVVSFLLVSSCATYDPQYKNPKETYENYSDKEIEKRFYLVGDAGLSPMNGMSDALTSFNKYLKTETTSGNYTIYLGDNIYPAGMESPTHPRRKQSENMIDAQYRAVKDYDGPVIFIPGNHEWYSGSNLGVKRQEDYIIELFQDKEVFKPRNGCALESIDISQDIQLIIIDTQWVLEDWNKSPTINEFCDIKTREKFLLELGTELDKNQEKTIVFAMHHPMFTNGTHGGYFALEKHLYPFQKKIPMPVLASLVVQIRSQGGVSVQDRYNELYNNFMNELQKMVQNHERLVFVSGHDHNLQYIEKNGLKQIVSGAGSKESYAAVGETGYFSTGMQGFAVLDIFKDGSSSVAYYVADENLEPKLIFQKEIISKPRKIDVSRFQVSTSQDTLVPIFTQDSIQEALFFKTVWGSKYKNSYSEPVRSKIASLDTLYGGLKVMRRVKQEGYHVLLLQDKNGKEYRMRALGKNAFNIVPKSITESTEHAEIGKSKIKEPKLRGQSRDFYTASHAYGVLAIPKMAQAISVLYTKPELFYVPKQMVLGKYNEDFGDQLYLISGDNFEENREEDFYNYPSDVETTDDILIKLRKTGEVLLDEENYIKSRLFDMLIGNWHNGNNHFRWVEYYNENKERLLAPLPKHRDNAFSSYEGNILDITNSIFTGTLENHIYDAAFTDLKWFNEEAIILDRALIQKSGRNQWKFLAEKIQEELTEQVIEAAFADVPEEVRNESLDEIKENLKKRKQNLTEIADRYYDFLSDQQTITGTDADDIFEISRLSEGKTHVMVFSKKAGIKADTIYDRTFYSTDTKEIWIYGLDGDDHFTVEGDSKDLIFLRIIGGNGTDTYNLKNGKRVKIYDIGSTKSIVQEKNGGSLRFTDVYNLNNYDYRRQSDRTHDVLSGIGYNPDDGFRAAVQYTYRIDKFQRNPFSQQHQLEVSYFTLSNSFDISYGSEFANIKNILNLEIGARFTSPNYTINFFGYGNESLNSQADLGYSFNKVEMQHSSAFIGLLRNSNFGSLFKLRTKFDRYQLDSLENSFLSSKDAIDVSNSNYFATLEGIYQYRSFDDPLNPTIGMLFDLNLGITENLGQRNRTFGYLDSRIGFYNSLVKSKKLILKTNIAYQQRIGNGYEFYQSTQLGGSNGLRGFRDERFSGKSSLAGSADIRFSFPSFKIRMRPFQLGIYGGGDVGRIWSYKESSSHWHNSQGGGLWLNGAGGLNANLSAFTSQEGTRLVFGLGFDF